MFPSPYGVTVIKSIEILNIVAVMMKFPSPYGVTVIKSDYWGEIGLYVYIERFRPLTG